MEYCKYRKKGTRAGPRGPSRKKEFFARRPTPGGWRKKKKMRTQAKSRGTEINASKDDPPAGENELADGKSSEKPVKTESRPSAWSDCTKGTGAGKRKG